MPYPSLQKCWVVDLKHHYFLIFMIDMILGYSVMAGGSGQKNKRNSLKTVVGQLTAYSHVFK
jgi:hypothetical protein